MKQLSPEWFAARKGMITGSRAGAALGVNPWQTPDQLMREMVREYHGASSERTANQAMEYGTLHEPIAKLDYMYMTGRIPGECGFFVHPEYRWMGASPDALLDLDGILEIKCPWKFRNDPNPAFQSIDDMPHYFAQVQIELACTGRKWASFYQWGRYTCPNTGRQVVNYKNEIVKVSGHWWDEKLPELKDFYQKFLQEIKNPAHLEPLRKTVNTDDTMDLVNEYLALGSEIDNATARRKEILDTLADLSGGKDAEIHGHKLTRVVREGSISYARAIKAYAPDADLEPFRGKPTEYWKLT